MRHGMVMNSFDSNSSAAKPLTTKPLTTKPLDDAILEVLARPEVKTLSAPEIANAIATDGDWHDLLVPIRSTAVALAQAGRLVIYRKGKPVDPTDFRGVYRLGLPRHD
ncbi:hypothetical protein V1291_005570 [Nitrobacteraceae bacterium AZCC 1564]